MFKPSIFPIAERDRLKLTYDGNPDGIGGKIFFDPQTGSLVTTYDVNGVLGMVDSGITFEEVIEDFSLSGQGVSRLIQMFQFATLETAQELGVIIVSELGLGFPVAIKIRETAPNTAAPMSKPRRDIVIGNPANGKSTEFNAGLKSQEFIAALFYTPPNPPEPFYNPRLLFADLRSDLNSTIGG